MGLKNLLCKSLSKSSPLAAESGIGGFLLRFCDMQTGDSAKCRKGSVKLLHVMSCSVVASIHLRFADPFVSKEKGAFPNCVSYNE